MTGDGLIEKVVHEQRFEGGEGRAMRLYKGRETAKAFVLSAKGTAIGRGLGAQ